MFFIKENITGLWEEKCFYFWFSGIKMCLALKKKKNESLLQSKNG